MPLEILHIAFVLLCRSARLEGAEIAALAGLRIDLAGIEPVFAGLQFADHGVASFDVLSGSIETAAPVFPHDEMNLPPRGSDVRSETEIGYDVAALVLDHIGTAQALQRLFGGFNDERR